MSEQQQRVTLTDAATRCLQMKQYLASAAATLLAEDAEADRIIQRVLDARKHVHSYSIRNRLLQQWQAPMSRLVASLTAFERIAAEQEAEAVPIKGKRRRVMIRAGARAVWIWGRHTARRQFRDDLADEQREEVHVSYVPVSTWAIEDIILAANSEPLTLPDFVIPVDDPALYHGLLAFARHKGIKVEERGLHGPRGVSYGGRVAVQAGDGPEVQAPVLCHELAHEILSHHHQPGADRLPRGLAEGEAEMTKACVLRANGLDSPMSAAYCRNWGLTPQDLLQSLERVARAAGEIVTFVDEWRKTQ